MLYGDDLKEEVRDRTDIVDMISGYVSLQKRGANYVGLCPFHNEKTPSFSVSREKQMYYCFGCHRGGDVFNFLEEYDHLTFPEALEELAGRAGIALPKQEMSREERRENDARLTLRDMNKQAAVYFHYLLKSKRGETAMTYLKDRGLSDEMIQRFGLGYADIYRDDLYQYLKKKGYDDYQLKDSSLVTIDSVKGSYDKFFNRVIFPIMDANQRVIGFGGRVMGDGEPKYLNSKETILFDKGRNLYGLNYARRSRESSLILCEGYMDVISLHQAGFTNAVAPLGTAFTINQAMLLKRYTKEIILSFDSDGAGVNAALRALPILRDVGLKGRVLSMKPYKDPDELLKAEGTEGYRERLKSAEAGRMFEYLTLHDQYDQQDPESRTEFINALAAKIAEIEEPLERETYGAAAANRFMISLEKLMRLVNKYGRDRELKKANASYKKKPQTKESREAERKEEKRRPQRLLLTWLFEHPDSYAKIAPHISPSDFWEPLYHSVAILLFSQLEKGEKPSTTAILNTFDDLEDQREIAAIFNTHLKYAVSAEDQDKALTDVVRKVKLASITEEMAHVEDVMRWQELLFEKNKAQKLRIEGITSR